MGGSCVDQAEEDTVAAGLVWMGTIMTGLASVLSCLGVLLQKRAHNINERFPPLPEDESQIQEDVEYRQPMHKNFRWWLGLGCMVLGSVGDTAALPFVPMSRVAALGSITIIANIFLAPPLLGDRVTLHDLIGCAITVTGTTVAMWFGASSQAKVTNECLLEYWSDGKFWAYASIVIVVLATLGVLLMGFSRVSSWAVENHVIGGEFEDPPPEVPLPRDSNKPVGVEVANRQIVWVGEQSYGADVGLTNHMVITHVRAGTDGEWEEVPDKTNGACDVVQAAWAKGDDIAWLRIEARKNPEHLDTVWLHANLELFKKDPPDGWKSKTKCLPFVTAEGDTGFINKLKGPQFYPVAHAAFGGTLGAQSVMFAKTVLLAFSNIIRGTEVGLSVGLMLAFIVPMCACLFCQIYYLNAALRIYPDAIFVLPVYQAFWIGAGACSGLIFYQEYKPIPWSRLAWFWVGLVVCLVGMLILALRKHQERRGDPLNPEEPTHEPGDFEEVSPIVMARRRTLAMRRMTMREDSIERALQQHRSASSRSIRRRSEDHPATAEPCAQWGEISPGTLHLPPPAPPEAAPEGSSTPTLSSTSYTESGGPVGGWVSNSPGFTQTPQPAYSEPFGAGGASPAGDAQPGDPHLAHSYDGHIT